jgi:uncharacterized protein
MPLLIEQDTSRFRQIVRGHVKQNLRKFISNGELIGRQGKDLVSIPVPQIELPTFRFGENTGGVGQGEGDLGDPIGRGNNRQNGQGKAGDEPGVHILEVELTLEELAALLGEELELPRIQPKNKNNVEGEVIRYTSARRTGPESLRYFKRTYRAALKRQVASGAYDYESPSIIPIRDDKRYRSWKSYPRPTSNAVIFYMMDVSGSMSDRKKELVRLTAFWIDTWLQAHYKNLTAHYLVHDSAAYEVDSATFYSLRESGGTRISSAYSLFKEILQKQYDPDGWNIYAFHFSDGENFDDQDDQRCLALLQETILPQVNLFCYGQVRSGIGPQFMDALSQVENEKLIAAKINNSDEIYTAIKAFLGKGY